MPALDPCLVAQDAPGCHRTAQDAPLGEGQFPECLAGCSCCCCAPHIVKAPPPLADVVLHTLRRHPRRLLLPESTPPNQRSAPEERSEGAPSATRDSLQV
eukprot:353294-Chlamydomonas_euryale.AAC.4